MSGRLNYMKQAPEGMKALGGVYQYITQCGLDMTLVELVYLRISLINGCAYCIDMHSAALLKQGVPSNQIGLVPVWAEVDGLFTPQQRAALRWAEIVTHIAATHVPEEEFTAIRAVFSEKEVADLTIAIGLMNAYNRMAISFRAVPASMK